MQILENIAVIVMFLALGAAASLGMGFFVLKLQLPSKQIKEMEKMEEFFKRNKKKIKDVNSFFSEQWKPYLQTLLKKCTILTILSTLVLFLCGITTYSMGVTGGREEGILIFSFMGVLFLWMCFCIGVRLMRVRKYNSKFPKAKEDFQRQYPSYTNQRLNYEIVKYDNDRIELGASFVQDDIMWFCSDFLLFGQMRVYSFIFIRYEDIEYILVKKTGHTSYRRISPNLYYRFCIYYRIKGEEKKFTFLSLSDYPLVREFKKKNIEVSEFSNE